MTAVFSAAELAAATGGSWLNGAIPPGQLAISTDTRSCNDGRIFFALCGEKFDAHDFLPQAVASGCAAVCIDRKKVGALPDGIPALLTADPLTAMQDCALMHRKRFPGLTVFGVTGSVGKTSVKEMLRAILSGVAGEDAVLYTIGNTNNQIGVVQNLLRLNDKHRFAVLEAGTSAPGEIAPLARIISPFGAIVNSIAPCHLENLIDLDGVATEKSAIFEYLPPDGAAVFPADVSGRDILSAACGDRRQISFGLSGRGDVSAKFICGGLEGSIFELCFPDGEKFRIEWQLTGSHNALNAAGAAALAYACGISASEICKALPGTTLPGMRMKKTLLDGVFYFNDAYNANPASMRASVDLLAESDIPGRLLLVLGGMRELGDVSEKEHRNLLSYIAEKLSDAQIITIGREFEGISECHWNDAEDAGKYLQSILCSGDTVFAKGSRGNAVELALPPEVR